MSWAYVPASADLSSDCTSPSPEQIQSFLSSKTNFVSPFCGDAGQAHSSGTTCSLSTGDPGAAASMFLQPASHASPGALPALASASRMSGGSSRRSESSFARWNPNGSSWRTFQLSLLEEGLPLFSGPWPTSGLMRSGECFPANNWEPVTSESESLSWATPVAGNCKGEASNNRDLCRDAKGWPTPTSSVDTERYGNGSLKLDGQAKAWPTATARDYRSGKSNITHNSRPLSEVVCRSGPQDPEQNGETSRGSSGRLNSRFVQWLMGFPPGWSFPEELVSKHWETLCLRQLEQWLGAFSKTA